MIQYLEFNDLVSSDKYRNRYYDPKLSRFISADPLYLEEMDKRGVDSQELNLFAYVKNNPLKYTDPDGLMYLGGDPMAAAFDPMNEKAADDMVKGFGTALTGIAGSTVLPASAGGVILAAKGVATAGQAAIPFAMAYGGFNPQNIGLEVGISFLEGVFSGALGGYLGDAIRSFEHSFSNVGNDQSLMGSCINEGDNSLANPMNVEY